MINMLGSHMGGSKNEQKALAKKDATFYDYKQFASLLRRSA